MKRAVGFTLIELLITLVVAAVLMGVAIPFLSGLVFRTQLSTVTNELSSQLALARSEAVSRGRTAALCGSSDGFSCDGQWSRGFAVWVDRDRDGVADSDEFLRFFEQPSNVGLTAVTDEVAFDARGRRVGTDPGFVLEHEQCSSSRALANRVQVGSTGRPLVTAVGCGGTGGR